MLMWLLAVVVCPSVRLSVTRRCCVSTAELKITQTTPRDSPGTPVCWRQQSLVGDALFLLKFELKMTHPPPFRKHWFRPVSAHIASTVRASEKRSISTNRKSTTRFPTSHRWTVYVTPKTPKGWHKTRFCCSASKIQLLLKEVCCKASLCEHFQRQHCIATLFLYLTVHRWIAATSPST